MYQVREPQLFLQLGAVALDLTPGRLEVLFADGRFRSGHRGMLAPGSDQRLVQAKPVAKLICPRTGKIRG